MKVVTILSAFLIISGILFTSQTCYSQITSTIELDFKTKSFNNPFELEYIEEGDYYQLVISNFNSNLYKVTLATQDTILESKLEFPTFGSFNIDALSKIVTSVSAVATTTEDAAATAKDIVKNFSSQELMMFFDVAPKEKPSNKEEKILTAIKDLEERIQEEVAFLNAQKTKILAYKTEIDTLIFFVQKKIIKSQMEYPDLSASVSNGDIDAITIRLSEIRQGLSDQLSDVILHNEDYLKFIQGFKPILDEEKGNKDIIKQNILVKGGYEALIKTIVGGLDSLNPTKSAQLLSSLVNIYNNRENKYTSLPFRLSGDLGTLEIKIEARDASKSLLQNYTTSIQFPDPNKKNIFYGINTTFYISGLHDESFSIGTSEKIKTRDSIGVAIPTDTVQNYTVYQNNTGSTEVGMQALLSFGFRIDSDYLKGMLSFGPAINFNNTVRPRVCVGAGLAFGRRNVLTLNGGWIGGSVDVKSEAIVVGGTGSEVKPDQLTNSKFSSSWFISLGYFFNP